MDDRTREALIQEILEDAFADYAGVLPPDVLSAFRAEVEDALEAHPHGSMLVRRALQDPELDESGETRRPAAEFDVDPAGGKSGAGSA